MKYLKNNFAFKFVVTLFLIGLLIGFGIHYGSNFNSVEYIENFKSTVLSTKINTFFPSIITICIIFLSSITIIGMPICFGVILYESISMGFTLATFMAYNGLKSGLFYGLFFLITKVFHIILIIYFVTISMKFSYKILLSLYNKDKEILYGNLIKQLYKFILVLIMTLIISTIVYFFANTFIEKVINFL